MTVAEIVGACKAVKDVATPVLQELRAQRLSREERELLVAAAKDGQCYAFDAEQLPAFLIVIGDQQFPNQTDDLASLAVYHDALASLARRGFVEHVDGTLFHLTASGFDRARYLATHP
jgi:hypothetical protein